MGAAAPNLRPPEPHREGHADRRGHDPSQCPRRAGPGLHQALAAKLTEAQAQAALDPLLAAIKTTTDPFPLRALAQAVQALAAKLAEAQAQAALDPLLSAIKTTTDPFPLRALAQAVQALPATLTEAQVQAALDRLLAAIKATTDPDALGALAQAVAAASARWPAAAPKAITALKCGLAKSPTLEVAKAFIEVSDTISASYTSTQYMSFAFDMLRYPTVYGYAEKFGKCKQIAHDFGRNGGRLVRGSLGNKAR